MSQIGKDLCSKRSSFDDKVVDRPSGLIEVKWVALQLDETPDVRRADAIRDD